MDETVAKLFDCPDYLQGKYCHALCNFRHQTEEEKQASASYDFKCTCQAQDCVLFSSREIL